jgi:D-alanyl-lipoteichoic acid acyltransferase DltB (MBOAT superfamily)
MKLVTPEPKGKTTVNWYDYIASFFAGLFLTNVISHFVYGISGDRFPTPFARPPGKGLSSPTVNVVWALFNLLVGYILFRVGKVSSGNDSALVVFFAGIVAISIPLSVRFSKKQTE